MLINQVYISTIFIVTVTLTANNRKQIEWGRKLLTMIDVNESISLGALRVPAEKTDGSNSALSARHKYVFDTVRALLNPEGLPM